MFILHTAVYVYTYEHTRIGEGSKKKSMLVIT
jgi:hypothetical protein